MCPWWLIELIYTGKVELIPHWWKGYFDVVCPDRRFRWGVFTPRRRRLIRADRGTTASGIIEPLGGLFHAPKGGQRAILVDQLQFVLMDQLQLGGVLPASVHPHPQDALGIEPVGAGLGGAARAHPNRAIRGKFD